jgi:hypothetical protein
MILFQKLQKKLNVMIGSRKLQNIAKKFEQTCIPSSLISFEFERVLRDSKQLLHKFFVIF